MSLVGRPSHIDAVQRIAWLVAQQNRQPGQEAVAGVAARAVAAVALVDGQLVVGVAAELPLLEAGVAQRLAVADRANVGSETRPRLALPMRRVALTSLRVLRTVAVLTLDVGQLSREGELVQHRAPVVTRTAQ